MPDRASDEEPWWSADDSAFVGATPIFESSDDQPTPADDSADGPDTTTRPDMSAAGSPVMEALRLASALSEWSRESGLSDTLRALASEAASSLSDAGLVATETPDEDSGGDGASREDQQRTPLRLVDPPAGYEGGAHESTCEYCPLCRGLDVMRTVQPQLATGIAEAMASLTEALTAALTGLTERQGGR